MTKVLIVDDSALMRRLLGGVLGDAGFQVETARNGHEGVERLTEWQPDVVTLDVNMPEMDGITALSLMMQARPTPVVMVSSLTAKGAQVTMEALALGAVDFVAKPGGTISLSVDDIAQDLISKVKAASRARLRRAGAPVRTTVSPPAPSPAPVSTPRRTLAPAGLRSRPAAPVPGLPAPSAVPPLAMRGLSPQAAAPASAPRVTGQVEGVVLIGVSTGGPRTLEDILPALPANFPWPVLVAQHMPANFTDAFAQRMARACAVKVREANCAMPLEAGSVYIGQGGFDMVVGERLGRLVVMPKPETPGHPWHPSVDVLVDSALKFIPAHQLIGVLLTGMGNDGGASMTRLRQQGGRTIAESQESCVVFGMPQDLIARGGAQLVLHSNEVSRQLCAWTG